MVVKKVVKSEIDPKVNVVVKKATPKKVGDIKLAKVAVTKEAEPVEAPITDMNTAESKPRSSVDRGSLLLGVTLLVVGAVWIL